ncbi:hypothetical protein [Moorena sp. SIO4A1]|uniref:hypothetical protein n=1 Tax=Moorena sp. SIO4A1 TaxID=2607835 RepID=UPI0025E12BFD|nr:hypothetical protein [Moorena sp. SIO4A1]
MGCVQEPYIKAYANGSVDAWMGAASFEAVRTTQWWWLHQITQGLKPLSFSRALSLFQGVTTQVGLQGQPFGHKTYHALS